MIFKYLIEFKKRYLLDRLYLTMLYIHLFFALLMVFFRLDVYASIFLESIFLPLFCIWLDHRHRRFDAAVFRVRYLNNGALFEAEQGAFMKNLATGYIPLFTLLLFNCFVAPENAGFIVPMLCMYLVVGWLYLLLKRIFNRQIAIALIFFAIFIDMILNLDFIYFGTKFYILAGPTNVERFTLSNFIFEICKAAAIFVALFVLSVHFPKDHLPGKD